MANRRLHACNSPYCRFFHLHGPTRWYCTPVLSEVLAISKGKQGLWHSWATLERQQGIHAGVNTLNLNSEQQPSVKSQSEQWALLLVSRALHKLVYTENSVLSFADDSVLWLDTLQLFCNEKLLSVNMSNPRWSLFIYCWCSFILHLHQKLKTVSEYSLLGQCIASRWVTSAGYHQADFAEKQALVNMQYCCSGLALMTTPLFSFLAQPVFSCGCAIWGWKCPSDRECMTLAHNMLMKCT